MRELLDLIDDDTTLVSVNRRLSRALLEAYAERRVGSGERVWRTPDVIPFTAWVDRAFRRAAENRSDSDEMLLRPAQERMVWEQVVRRHSPPGDDSTAPLSAFVAARRARDAHALIEAWRISPEAPEFDFSAESRTYRTWERAFQFRCRQAGWIDAAQAASALADPARLAAAELRRRMVFAGFDVMTAQQGAIRAALSRCGIEVVEAAPTQRSGRTETRVFDDPAGELQAAAAWARQLLSEAPESRVGIVVPELHRIRSMVERIFDEALSPGCAVPGRPAGPRHVNLSYGIPASRIGVVGDALIALRLCCARIELAEAGRLLRSPYIAGGGEGYYVRARLDAGLRDAGEAEIGLDRLRARSGPDPVLHGALRDLVALRAESPRRRPLRAWSAYFSRWLAALGWPGDRTLESAEYQAVETFRGLLDELAAMGAVAGRLEREQALSLLLELADENLFQPQQSQAAPVQVLGVLETAGLEFDALWFSGLHDGSWPPPPQPDPFVPVVLQRGAGVPSASPEGQLEFARRRLGALCRAADRVVLSHARYDQDEPLRPSPLLGSGALEAAEAPEDWEQAAFGPCLNRGAIALERVEDEVAPALAVTLLTRGGAAVLRDQAACPFRAFARWRLDARGVPVAASPLDARIRGNLVHAVLHHLWSGIRSRANLVALSAEALGDSISAAVDQALERERQRRPETLQGNFARIEQDRLRGLIADWLELEKRRSAFEVVARENDTEVTLGPLHIRIRPDRVDRLESGSHFVVDYKTGNHELRHWFGDRPEDPQLAVYTLAIEADGGGPVAGAAYGSLKRGTLGFKGLADLEGIAEGVSTLDSTQVKAAAPVQSFAALKSEWRETLEALAESFASGCASVSPKNPHVTCARCEVMPLCRIFEQGTAGEGDEA